MLGKQISFFVFEVIKALGVQFDLTLTVLDEVLDFCGIDVRADVHTFKLLDCCTVSVQL